MAQPCRASANLSASTFCILRQLTYASITWQRPTPFLTLTHTSYRNGGLLSKPGLSIRRCFRTSLPTYNSSQSHVAENANSTTTGKSLGENATAQPGPTHSDSKGATHKNLGGHSARKEKRVNPRRHRKDKPDETQRPSKKPLIKYTKSDRPTPEPWQIQKEALKRKFKDGWNPRKKLPPDEIQTVKHLHAQDPARYSTSALSEQFKVSPEAIRRILKSQWRPSEEQQEKRRESWKKRESKIWSHMSEIGLRPKRRGLSPYADAAVRETQPKTEP